MQPREVLEAYIAAAQRGDWDTAYGIFADDRFDRPDGAIEILRTNVYRVGDDRIVEVWIFEQNQHEVDELLA